MRPLLGCVVLNYGPSDAEARGSCNEMRMRLLVLSVNPVLSSKYFFANSEDIF